MLGHNIGAKTAMHFALHYPDRTAAMISLDTLPVRFDSEHPAMKQTLESLKQIAKLDVKGKTRKAAIASIQE